MGNFGVHHMHGSEETNPPITCLEPLYEELFSSSYSDGTVAVSNDDLGLIIEACRSKNAIILIDANNLIDENGNASGRHMNNVPKKDVIELWKLLIEGKTGEVFARPWLDGFHS